MGWSERTGVGVCKGGRQGQWEEQQVMPGGGPGGLGEGRGPGLVSGLASASICHLVSLSRRSLPAGCLCQGSEGRLSVAAVPVERSRGSRETTETGERCVL